MLARIQYVLSILVYFTLLNYNILVWGQLSDNQLHRIQTLQNKAFCITNFADYTTWTHTNIK